LEEGNKTGNFASSKQQKKDNKKQQNDLKTKKQNLFGD